jgi:hypothetical protein
MALKNGIEQGVQKLFKFLDQARISVGSEALDADTMAEITRLWEESHPADNFGILEAILVDTNFRKGYMTQLQQGHENAKYGVDTFVKEVVTERGKISYIIHEKSADLDESQLPIMQLHQKDTIEDVRIKLEQLYTYVVNAAVPDAVKDAYLEKCEQWLIFCETALAVGTPEFTIKQNKKRLKELPRGLAFWNFSNEELEPSLNIEQLKVMQEIGAAHIAHLFMTILKRVNLDQEWKVEISSAAVAITINGEAKKVKIPAADTFPMSEIGYLLAHEFVHILRGENGSRQIIKLLQGGTEGYEVSDEGLALLAELLAGEPFGHDHQVKMAARYYAIALSLKTCMVDGKPVAMYSSQEIYTILRNFGVPHKDVSDIVWRINRETSCTRQTIETKLVGPQGEIQLHLAETFFKDTIYFEGQMALYNFFKEMLPVQEADRTSEEYVQTQDFNRSLLARVGRALLGSRTREAEQTAPILQEINLYERAQFAMSFGEDAILNLMDFFMIGKIPFEKLIGKNSPWHTAILRDNLVEYRALLQNKIA